MFILNRSYFHRFMLSRFVCLC